jgi:hypothetical protein
MIFPLSQRYREAFSRLWFWSKSLEIKILDGQHADPWQC